MQNKIEVEVCGKNPNLSIVKFQDNYFCFDNLNPESVGKIHHTNNINNDENQIIICVTQGSLNISVNETKIKLKQNSYFVITPFTTIKILESKCRFFGYMMNSIISQDFYGKIGVEVGVKEGCYTYHHYILTAGQTSTLRKCYEKMKYAAGHDLPIMKEQLLKARIGIYLSHALTYIEAIDEIPHVISHPSQEIFDQFLQLLEENYKEQRFVQFYADKLNIETKHLSATTSRFTGKTASRIIDDYVVYRIKVVLYNNRHNIKEVSDMFNFPTQSFFGRYFRRVVGCSPRKYITINSRKLANQKG